jgi:hypothetical protein
VAGEYDDSLLAEGLCDAGVRFYDADSAQLDALHAAVAPVIDELDSDPATASLLQGIKAVAAEHSDVDAIEVADSCRSAGPVGEAAVAEQPSTLPDGAYRVQITVDEVAEYGVSNSAGWSGTWTITIRDGIFEVRCASFEAPGKDCGNELSDGTDVFEAGYVRGGDGPVVYFVGDAEVLADRGGCIPPDCSDADPYWFDWELDGDQLVLTNPGPAGEEVFNLAIEPLTRIS